MTQYKPGNVNSATGMVPIVQYFGSDREPIFEVQDQATAEYVCGLLNEGEEAQAELSDNKRWRSEAEGHCNTIEELRRELADLRDRNGWDERDEALKQLAATEEREKRADQRAEKFKADYQQHWQRAEDWRQRADQFQRDRAQAYHELTDAITQRDEAQRSDAVTQKIYQNIAGQLAALRAAFAEARDLCRARAATYDQRAKASTRGRKDNLTRAIEANACADLIDAAIDADREGK